MRLGHQGDLAVAIPLLVSDDSFQGLQTHAAAKSPNLKKKIVGKTSKPKRATKDNKQPANPIGFGPPSSQIVKEIAFNEKSTSISNNSDDESRDSRDAVSFADTLFTTGSLLYNISHPLAKSSLLHSDTEPDSDVEEQRDDSLTELDSLKSNSLKAYFPDMHTISEKSPDYPQYLRQASPDPPKYPSRREWIPLKPTPAQQVNGWMIMLKRLFTTQHRQNEECGQVYGEVKDQDKESSSQKKTEWTLSSISSPSLQRHRSKTLSFQKNPVRSSSFLQRISRKSSSHEPKTPSESSSRTTVVSRHQKASPTPIRFCNQYVKVEGGAWVFLHRDPEGNILGAYQIKSSYI